MKKIIYNRGAPIEYGLYGFIRHKKNYHIETYNLATIYWAQNEMYMGGDRKKEKRFVGQRVVYDDGIKAYKTKCLRGFN